jgi:hypothetical protein
MLRKHVCTVYAVQADAVLQQQQQRLNQRLTKFLVKLMRNAARDRGDLARAECRDLYMLLESHSSTQELFDLLAALPSFSSLANSVAGMTHGAWCIVYPDLAGDGPVARKSRAAQMFNKEDTVYRWACALVP